MTADTPTTIARRLDAMHGVLSSRAFSVASESELRSGTEHALLTSFD